MIRRFLLAMVMVLGASMVSHAGMLAGAPIVGNSYQNRAWVILYNAGTTPVTILSKEIILQPNVVLPIAGEYFLTDNILQPGHTCSFYANITHSQAYAARVKVDGSAEALCGVLQLRDDSNNTAQVDLRPIR